MFSALLSGGFLTEEMASRQNCAPENTIFKCQGVKCRVIGLRLPHFPEFFEMWGRETSAAGGRVPSSPVSFMSSNAGGGIPICWRWWTSNSTLVKSVWSVCSFLHKQEENDQVDSKVTGRQTPK